MSALSTSVLTMLLALPVVAKEPSLPILRYVASQAESPFISRVDTGEYTGIFPDLISRIIEPLGYQAKYSTTFGGRALMELIAGRGDLTHVSVFADVTLDAYPKDLLICPQPFITIPFQIFSLRPELIDLPMEAITDLKIGVIRIAAPTRAFKRTLGVNNLNRYTTSEQVFKALMSKRVDLVFMDPYTMESLSKAHNTKMPYQLRINLGLVKGHLALTREAEQRLGIFEPLCQQVEKANKLDYFSPILRGHRLTSSR